ncbi:hypothetical protein AB0C04_16010 [Micromonospora sp. NPDC048909]|uniref:hypothetical protein n=1 Tax=Micromonospora sp. NPDC048909 TaxID=3155643 RepID=UPI0033E886AF
MEGNLTWIDQIIEVTGWRQDPERVDWEQVEAELGVALPTDFKELCRRFVPGAFYAYLDLLRPTGDHASQPLLRTWASSRQHAIQHESSQLWTPYEMYGPDKGPGLIQWGSDQTEGEYYWLADRCVEPDRWPVVARWDGIEPWHQYDMSTAEFVYRVIADPEFKPFTVAEPPRRPFYLPYWGPFPLSVEEWLALTDPNRES